MRFYVEQNRKFKHVFQILCLFMYWGEGAGMVGGPLYVHVGCGGTLDSLLNLIPFQKRKAKNKEMTMVSHNKWTCTCINKCSWLRRFRKK